MRKATRFVIAMTVLLIVSPLFISIVIADENTNVPQGGITLAGELDIDLPFDPNAYSFLIYVPYGDQDNIRGAMEDKLGISLDPNDDIRDRYNPVTLADLATHDILIVGWNHYGYTSGLSASVLAQGITGRVILSGHDADYHTVEGPQEPASKLLVQMIDYVLHGAGTGMITLGCSSSFPYLPSDFGVTASSGGTNTVTEFTYEGLYTGIYNGLTPAQLSNWGQSYHNTFTLDEDSDFIALELGGDGDDIVTVTWMNIYDIELSKTDDVDPNGCIEPNDVLTYTISWSRPADAGGGNTGPITLIDYLPREVDVPGGLQDPNYDWFNHTYTWALPAIAVDSSGSFQLSVVVNELAEPLGSFTNRVSLYNEYGLIVSTTETTDVCCWGGDIVYTDQSATGANTGASWADAYVDLQRALARTRLGCGDEIWVAAGTYTPGASSSDTYALVDGVEMYGGFRGNETDISQRPGANGLSVLTGNDDCRYVVTAEDVDNTTILDGFTIRNATYDGMTCIDGDLTVSNCIVTDNIQSGIFAFDSSLTVSDCYIYNNGRDGVELTGAGQPFVTHCIVRDNIEYGISTNDLAANIGNCFVNHNGSDGIYLDDPTQMSSIYNVTLTYNTGQAIYQRAGTAADAFNCVLWGNNADSYQYSNCDLSYSCCYDPNDPSGISTPDLDGNITVDPCFVYDDPNNYHLRPASACVDLGYNYTGSDTDTDLDDDDRLFDGDGDYIDEIDMGCDEVDCNDVEHEWDFNHDGIINIAEFRLLANAWGADSSDPNWADPYSQCDFYADNVIDWLDLAEFADVWLWQACWLNPDAYGMMMAMGGDGGGMMAMALDGGLMMATATFESVSAEPAASTTASAEQLDAALYARWFEIRAPYTPNLAAQIQELEEIIYWVESIPVDYPDLWDEFDQDNWYDFLDDLREELEDLWAEYLQQ